MQLLQEGYETNINAPFRLMVQTVDGRRLEILRVVDVIAQRAGEVELHIEQKTGDIARAMPTLEQAFHGGERNLQLLADMIMGAMGEARNLWQFTQTLGPSEQGLIERRLTNYAQFLMDELNMTEAQVRQAVETFRIRDAEQMFEPALEFIFGADGPIARVARRAAARTSARRWKRSSARAERWPRRRAGQRVS